MTLAVEAANSKLVDIENFAAADIEGSVDDSLVRDDSLATALDNSFSVFIIYLKFPMFFVKT